MKQSEKLEIEAGQQDNDFKAFRMHAQAKKEAAWEHFEEVYLPEIKAASSFKSIEMPDNCFRITLQSDAVFDYFPKSDRLCFIRGWGKRSPNHWQPSNGRWVSNGINWIVRIMKLDI